MPEFASKCLDDVLEESNIPITPDSINGVWELIPDDSGSLLELYTFMNPNACVEDSEFFDFYTSRSIKDYITLTDKKYSVRSVSHRFIATNEELLIDAEYDQITNDLIVGKSIQQTIFNNQQTELITKTKSNIGIGQRTRKLIKNGKNLLVEFDWCRSDDCNKEQRKLKITRLFSRSGSIQLCDSIMSKSISGSVMLVVGGCGFLGQHLVEHILTKDWDCKVRIFDIRPPQNEISHPRVEFFQGNICSVDDIVKACKDVHTIFHTASPPEGRGRQLYEMVNVQGTNNIIEAAKIAKVPQIVFTSTASVIFDGHDIINGDETIPYVTKFLDPYIETKIQAEKAILNANGKDGLKTCAIRPSGIFGPRDAQAWPGIIEAGKKGQSKYQLGKGTNLMDWTYVENVAHAHCIAAEKLAQENAPAAGEAFFITNNEPLPFWEMPKLVWDGLGYQKPSIVIPAFLILWIAWLMDLIVWILSPIKTIKPSLTYFRTVLATTNRSFSSEKAKKLLGYEPIFSLAEGVKKSLDYFKDERNPNATDKK